MAIIMAAKHPKKYFLEFSGTLISFFFELKQAGYTRNEAKSTAPNR